MDRRMYNALKFAEGLQRKEDQRKQKEEDAKARREMQTYMIKEAFKHKLDMQKEGYETQRERQKSRSELRDPTAKWKQDIKKEARGDVTQKRYQDLYAKKQAGTLTPTEEAQFNVVAKKATGAMPKKSSGDYTPYQQRGIDVKKNNAVVGVKSLFDFAQANNGNIKVKGKLVPLTKNIIMQYLLKYHKGIDLTDSEMSKLIEENIAGMPKQKKGFFAKLFS